MTRRLPLITMAIFVVSSPAWSKTTLFLSEGRAAGGSLFDGGGPVLIALAGGGLGVLALGIYQAAKWMRGPSHPRHYDDRQDNEDY